MKSKAKSTVSIVSAASAAASPAFAEILHTDLGAGIGTYGGNEVVYFSLSEEWAERGDRNSRTDYGFSLDYAHSNLAKPIIVAADSHGAAQSEDFVMNLAPNVLISSEMSFRENDDVFLNNERTNDQNWKTGTRAYVGLRFMTPEASYRYGWADVEYAEDWALRLYGFAYENSGDGIRAGVIPEPGTTALLTALAAGSAVLFERRRRAARMNA